MSFKAAFYKGTHPGWPGVYNRLVRAVEHGRYSHVELIFSDGMAASSSFMDHGVRFKAISFDPALWDLVELPARLEAAARDWVISHAGWGYDLWGNVHFIFGWVRDSNGKVCCSESVAAALGMEDPWRFEPNALASALKLIEPLLPILALPS